MKKGFALVFLVIILSVILLSGVGLYMYTNKKSIQPVQTESVREISDIKQNNNNDSPGDNILNDLSNKMKSYKNYQLDLAFTTGSKRTQNRKVLRVGEKQLSLSGADGKLMENTIFYLDGYLKKSFSYSKDSNKYLEEEMNELEYEQVRPEYYLKNLTNLSFH